MLFLKDLSRFSGLHFAYFRFSGDLSTVNLFIEGYSHYISFQCRFYF